LDAIENLVILNFVILNRCKMLLGILNAIISDPELAILPEAYHDQNKFELKSKVKLLFENVNLKIWIIKYNILTIDE
jgi:hypothetical protein